MTNFEYYKTREKAFEAYSKIETLYNIHNTSAGRFISWLYDEYKPSEEVIAHTPIFDVIKGDEIEEGFRPVKIKSPDWVSIIVEKDGKFLMERQLRYGLNKEFEEFPCGMVETNEPIMHAALRELEEETGLRCMSGNPGSIAYLGKYAANPAFMTNYMHYFYIDLNKCEWNIVDRKLDKHEHLTTNWVDKKIAYDNFLKSEGSSIMGCAWMLLIKERKIQ